MTTTLSGPATHAGLRVGLRSFTAAGMAGSAHEDRRRYHTLRHLSDATLRDIGLERDNRKSHEPRRGRGALW